MALHPTLAGLQEKLKASGRPDISQCSPDQARQLLADSAAALGKGPDVFSVTPQTIPTRQGDINARLYRSGPTESGLIVYVHGGGWVIGSLDDFDALARMLCKESGCALLLVDYRLAPEHPFPQGLNDVIDAMTWAHSNCRRLADGDVPLVVAGDSAGANLATVALGKLKGTLSVALQLLVYPVTDSSFATDSYTRYGQGGYLLTERDMRWFFQHYAPQSLWTDPDVSPLYQEALSGLPKTWIALAECDVLHDEGVLYAQKLKSAGVDVTLAVYSGMAHGFIRMANVVDVSKAAVQDAGAAIRAACQDNIINTEVQETKK